MKKIKVACYTAIDNSHIYFQREDQEYHLCGRRSP